MMRYVWIGLVAWCLGAATDGKAQSLIDLFRSERVRVQAEHLRRQYGMRAVPLPPVRIPVLADTLWARRERPAGPAAEAPSPPSFPIARWQLVRKLERPWFEKRFAGTAWAFLGSNTFHPLDTLRTRDLRARLQAHFGPPTLTLAELDLPGGRARNARARDTFIQFEYWFVLNDSIPFVVMDVNGPLERGLVVASDSRYRDDLFAIRQALLGRLVEEGRREPYVDYYFHADTNTWYRTGYKHGAFFMERIPRPELFRGRPLLRGPAG
ncbi:MAG: hypothetical protein KatS3mg043_0163 [Rhodothermaceae bacterium]|nr:MAG: hypothetical protein KatS3mg043_0163 [Rhodothermaceae bacterium]